MLCQERTVPGGMQIASCFVSSLLYFCTLIIIYKSYKREVCLQPFLAVGFIVKTVTGDAGLAKPVLVTARVWLVSEFLQLVFLLSVPSAHRNLL